jgi:hypothetical protein
VPLTNAQLVRAKTTYNETLVSDDEIIAWLEQNTSAGVVNINLTIADIFDLMAAKTEEGGINVKQWSRGSTAMTYSSSYREAASYYRALGGGLDGTGGIVQRTITRNDWPPATRGPQYGREDVSV